MDNHPKIFRPLVPAILLILLITSLGSPLVGAQSGEPPPDSSSGTPREIGPEEVLETADAYPGSTSYDSGWLAIGAGTTRTLTHNLGGSVSNYVVDLRFYSESANYVYNQIMYGGNQLIAPVPAGYSADDRVGAYWHSLTTTSIKVYRMPEDITYATKIRVRIWYVASANYDSGWFASTPGFAITKNFTITSGSADDYLVYLEFKDTGLYQPPATGFGIHQRYYGGASLAGTNDVVGAYWRNLTANSIVLYARLDDAYIDQMRVRIWRQPKATYDSGWEAGDLGSNTFLPHGIGGNPDDYIVDLQQKDTDAIGIGVNQRCYGGCDLRANDGAYAGTKQGAYWSQLTSGGLLVARRADDTFADQFRVRIWNVWSPTAPDYDSDWKTTPAGGSTEITHSVGGSADDYLTQFDYYYTSYRTHQLFYGFKVFGADPPYGYSANQAGGAFWHALDNTSVTVLRAATDITTEKWRMRIWEMPTPDYDSGWTTVAAGVSKALPHGLIGSPSDFLVDLTFKDSGYSGIHQRYLGGMTNATGNFLGAHWGNFNTSATNATLTVYRYPDDTLVDQFRVRIWRIRQPDYESGYQAYAPGGYACMTHNLGVDSGRVLVDATAHSASGDHKFFYGRVDIRPGDPWGYADNARVGFYWYYLTGTSVCDQRMPEDASAQTINVRLWVTPPYIREIYLPVVWR